MMKTLRILLITLWLAPLSGVAASSDDYERADLTRLIDEFDFLIQETTRLEQRHSGSRLRFNFDALRRDLTYIRARVVHHLDLTLSAPNQLAPIPRVEPPQQADPFHPDYIVQRR